MKKLAQQWLDELSSLLQAGNSPFSVAQDQALASLINYAYSPARYPNIKMLNEGNCFRPDEYIGALFYQLLLLLDNTNFTIAKQRMGDLSANDSEGAIPDSKLLRQAINSVSNLRHSEGYHYSYTNNELAQVATEYLHQPLILDSTGQDNDVKSKLQALIAHYTSNDNLTSIETLYFNGIKLLKRLREPGMIRHVVTRQKYKLNATKL